MRSESIIPARCFVYYLAHTESLINVSSKYLLRVYYMPGIIEGIRDAADKT